MFSLATAHFEIERQNWPKTIDRDLGFDEAIFARWLQAMFVSLLSYLSYLNPFSKGAN